MEDGHIWGGGGEGGGIYGCLWKGRGFKPIAHNGNVREIELWPYCGLNS